MSSLTDFASYLEQTFAKEIKAHRIMEPSKGQTVPFPNDLDPKLAKALRSLGYSQLYSHQREAFESIQEGKDTVLVSQTASGKTLGFLLPILNAYLGESARFGVMLLYPTKALSRDQEHTMSTLMSAVLERPAIGTFDGDTPRPERRKLQRSADFVITNPDMLHAGILPNHNRAWKTLLSRLRFIVVDEVHIYRGAFGSHVSNVFRRLLRICELHGSHPRVVCSSATVGNPQPFVETLFQRPFQAIKQNGAPRPQRDLYFMNPPLITGHGSAAHRKGPAALTVPILRYLSEHRIRTICFCRARQEVERLYRACVDRHPRLSSTIKPYRGGLLPNERRSLERDFARAKINTIITTNALELGIDIGDLDVCILSGHPGTVASFWQQAGRVGRNGSGATILFVAKDTPVDQYLVHHPEFITTAPVEEAWLSADNPYILLQHLPCAAYERPLAEAEDLYTDRTYHLAVQVLAQDKTLTPYHSSYRYALSDYPARGVSLRGLTDYNVNIHCGTTVIGELDPIGARGTLYKDAIYQHLGKRYMSLDLDLDKKLCQVEEVDVDYYTEAVWENRLEMTTVETEKDQQGAPLRFGVVHVNKQSKLYKKIRERSFENVGYGPITLPAFEYETTGLSLFPPLIWKETLDKIDKRFASAAMYGLSYVLQHTAPSLCMADKKDIATDVALQEQEAGWKSSLYLYDTHEGGVGYAEKIFDRLEEALKLCLAVLEECECTHGCPSCTPPLPPGVQHEELEEFLIESDASARCTHSLLVSLIHGRVEIPEVQLLRSLLRSAIKPEIDEELVKLNKRLTMASTLLRKKSGSASIDPRSSASSPRYRSAHHRTARQTGNSFLEPAAKRT